MNKEIRYDFVKSSRCVDVIEASAAALDAEVIRKNPDAMFLITQAVDCLSTDVLLAKLEDFMTDTTQLKNELLLCAEELKQLSQRMYLAEEEARRIAAGRESGE